MERYWFEARMFEAGPVAVCVWTGDVLLEDAQTAELALEAALGLEPAVLAVEASGVELFTSAGLNVLIRVHRKAVVLGIPLVLIDPSPGVRRTLEVTETAFLFPAYATPQQAAAARPGHHHDEPDPAVRPD